MRIKFLFITRNYPPKVGGLENYSYNLIREFESHFRTYKLVLSRSNLHLVWFLPYCLIMGLYIAWRRKVKYIHLCDALLSPLGVLLKLFTRARVSSSVAGLDITFRNSIYQRIVPWCVAKMDAVICISNATRDECVARGIRPEKCKVIPVGIRSEAAHIDLSRGELLRQMEQLFNVKIADKLLLVTVGRLVKRKGVAWFVENVFPGLSEDFLYFIIGEGPEYEKIETLIKDKHLSNRVFLLGKLPDEERNVILNTSDIFIMPNITVPGDVEGFGIVAIEAGSCGLPVIASNLQGIKDAVIEGKTGYLVQELDAEAFAKRIKGMDLRREEVRWMTNRTFDWAQIYKRYRDILMEIGTRSE